MQAGCIPHRTPLPPSAAPAGITHYTLQARSCAKGEEDSPLETPGFVGVWPKTAFLRPRPHPSETQRSGADQPTPRADLRRFFTRPAGRDGRKRIGKNRVFGLQFSTNWVIIKSTRIGGCNVKEVGKRLKALRESIGISQVKMAEAIGSTQSSINRYENGQSTPPVELFRRYADYFDVSLDYIFARTDKPQGVTYEFKPKAAPEREEMRRFIEMCFDPQSPMNEKLKETLFRMMEGEA